MNGRAWTSEEIAQLHKLARTYTATEIAQILGRTYDAVERQGRRVGVSFRKDYWTHEQIVQLRKLARTHTLAQAAEVLGRSYAGVRRKAGKLRISFQKYGEHHHNATVSDEQVREAVAEYWRGKSTQVEIGQRLGMRRACVNRWVNYTNRTWRTG